MNKSLKENKWGLKFLDVYAKQFWDMMRKFNLIDLDKKNVIKKLEQINEMVLENSIPYGSSHNLRIHDRKRFIHKSLHSTLSMPKTLPIFLDLYIKGKPK